MEQLPSYLKSLARSKGSVAALFKDLGGEEKLGVGLRNFRRLSEGTYPVNAATFSALFGRAEDDQKRELIIALVQQFLRGGPEVTTIVSWLDDALSDAAKEDVAAPATLEMPETQTYTDDQLHLLINNHDALRLHKHVLLRDRVPRDSEIVQLFEKSGALSDLIRLGLLVKKNGYLEAPAVGFVLPHPSKHGPAQVSLASQYVASLAKAYFAAEWSERQEQAYSFLWTSKDIAEKVMRQLRDIKARLIRNVKSPGKGSVAFLYVGTCRIFDDREI